MKYIAITLEHVPLNKIEDSCMPFICTCNDPIGCKKHKNNTQLRSCVLFM